jgi:hypothetical protein
MKQIRKTLFRFLFGERAKPVEPFYPGVKTTYPDKQPSYNVWCIKLNVSRLYTK